MKRVFDMIRICIAILAAAGLLVACVYRKDPAENGGPAEKPAEGPAVKPAENGKPAEKPAVRPSGQSSGNKTAETKTFAVRTVLRELTLTDPEKRIGVYGRYTELSAEGEVPEVLTRVLAEANARAKERVESRARQFLEDNDYAPAAAEPDGSDPDGLGPDGLDPSGSESFRFRNISCIVNVTRADSRLISILETEMESGIGDREGERIREEESCSFRAAVYDTADGRQLAPEDLLKDPGSLPDRLREALRNKYGVDGLSLYQEGDEIPAWTADHLGVRFYLDGKMVAPKPRETLDYAIRKAIHVSIPYTELDGPAAEAAAAAAAPESFIAQIEKNKDYALPHDKRSIRVEKAVDQAGYEQYRIVVTDSKEEQAWWLEYADDASQFYVFRTADGYFFYRLEEGEDRAYVYNFASPDGGYERFANQNAQCFDSFLHELSLTVPYDPGCVHMREKSRRFMETASGINTIFVPNGHYAFRPEQGRGRLWLHFALLDDALMLDSRNAGCRLLHELPAKKVDEEGQEAGETVIPKGAVLRFLRVNGESELYYYMSPQYNEYRSGARDYVYDCELSDKSQVRLVTRYEDSFFVDGMYLDRIGEPVLLGTVSDEAEVGEIPEHFVEIGGRKYKLIRDLSLKTEGGEEIDFEGETWWKVENYTGTFSSENGDAVLVIAENGDARFEYEGRVFTGHLPEKRYYGTYVTVYMEAEYERRSFQIMVLDKLPRHDPSFRRIRFYSAGEPATNEPSKVPPIEVELVRQPPQ